LIWVEDLRGTGRSAKTDLSPVLGAGYELAMLRYSQSQEKPQGVLKSGHAFFFPPGEKRIRSNSIVDRVGYWNATKGALRDSSFFKTARK